MVPVTTSAVQVFFFFITVASILLDEEKLNSEDSEKKKKFQRRWWRGSCTWIQGKCCMVANAIVMAGFIWAPEMWPTAWIMKMITRPNASDTPTWVTSPWLSASAMAAPHPENTKMTSQQREQCVTLLFIFIIIIDILKSIDLPCWAETNNCIFGYNLSNYYTGNWRYNLSRKNYRKAWRWYNASFNPWQKSPLKFG